MLSNSEFIVGLPDITVFWESCWQLIYLMIYVILVSIVFHILESWQEEEEVFDSVDTLPIKKQIIRVFREVTIFIPCLVWLLYYSEVIFLSLYLLTCHLLEMAPQRQILLLIWFAVIALLCINFIRSVLSIKYSYLEDDILDELVIEPTMEPIRERIITERVLVICPFCGKKNEQGIGKCQNCGADL